MDYGTESENSDEKKYKQIEKLKYLQIPLPLVRLDMFRIQMTTNDKEVGKGEPIYIIDGIVNLPLWTSV